MGRSGYVDDADGWELVMWRGAVASAIRGKRGQRLLRDLRTALDEMPEKALIAEELVTPEGEVCALGCVARKRGVDVSKMDPYEHDVLGAALNVAQALVQEIEFINDDEYRWNKTPEQRWESVSRWVNRHLKPLPESEASAVL